LQAGALVLLWVAFLALQLKNARHPRKEAAVFVLL